MRIFLNSNVLMDYLFKRTDAKTAESFHSPIEEIFDKADQKKFYFSTSSFSVEHVRRESLSHNILPEDFSLMENLMLDIFHIRVIKVSHIHKNWANDLMKKLGLQDSGYFEDFVNIAASLDEKSEIFLSRDRELIALARNLIEVMPPREFVRRYLTPQ